MNLIEYVSGYHHDRKRGDGREYSNRLHGQAFFDWFDEAFGLEKI